MERFDDWEARLAVYLDRVEWEPFTWGQHDCALFAASAICAQTGVDPAAEFRGKYFDARGAAQALRAYGEGTLLKTVTQWLGEPKSAHHAKRGDIVMRDRLTTGVCVGHYSYFVGIEQGYERLAILPTRDCQKAFTVPFAGAA